MIDSGVSSRSCEGVRIEERDKLMTRATKTNHIEFEHGASRKGGVRVAEAQGANMGSDVRLLARDDFDRDVWCVLGAPIDMVDLPGAVTTLEASVRDGERLSFVTPNVNWLVRALNDPEARAQMIDADLSLADGAPVVALAKLLGAPLRERAAGSDLFDALKGRSTLGAKLKVFFFGGRDGAAEAAYAAINEDRGGMEAVGWLNPGFGDVETMSSDKIIDEINAADPDFIVVSLGAAKGQAWIDHNQARLNASTIAHLGAVVDFAAGTIVRAPQWMAKSGLEWVWRVFAEGSLWKRYYKDGLSLLSLMARRLPRQLFGKSSKAENSTPSADVIPTAIGTTIKLAGSLTHDNLDPVRQAFREAAKSGNEVYLDFSDSDGFDHAFLGLVLMLEKHVTRHGKEIVLMNIDQRSIKLFGSNSMHYAVETDVEMTYDDARNPDRAAS